jgi:hypothetical protein
MSDQVSAVRAMVEDSILDAANGASHMMQTVAGDWHPALTIDEVRAIVEAALRAVPLSAETAPAERERLLALDERVLALTLKGQPLTAADQSQVRSVIRHLLAAPTVAQAPADLVKLVTDLKAHARDQGWQDVDDPIAALLAWEAPEGAAPAGATAPAKPPCAWCSSPGAFWHGDTLRVFCCDECWPSVQNAGADPTYKPTDGELIEAMRAKLAAAETRLAALREQIAEFKAETRGEIQMLREYTHDPDAPMTGRMAEALLRLCKSADERLDRLLKETK